MTTNVILPALGMAQENGTIVRWLKDEGEQVTKGEPIAEIETDKATVEIEAPASGQLVSITAAAGDVVPTGQVIARIVSADENKRSASPLASRIAAEHQLDVSLVPSTGRRIQKADVVSYLQSQQRPAQAVSPGQERAPRLLPASPKARRLAREYGANLAAIKGTGPEGAVLAADVARVGAPPSAATVPVAAAQAASPAEMNGAAFEAGEMEQAGETVSESASELAVGTIWRVMAERTAQSWSGTPHFYLV
ncbi:MAG TPA: biotin/lipoyl-containing protein, partial [Ktedonobacteraceae bacterium]|nr:biotin/lipoyl-containing protein [Ktedonobacteraceae bacterium]